MEELTEIVVYFDSNAVGYKDVNDVDTIISTATVSNQVCGVTFKEIQSNKETILAELRTIDNLKFKVSLHLKNYFALLNITIVNNNSIDDGKIYKLFYLDSYYHLIPNKFDLEKYKEIIRIKGV